MADVVIVGGGVIGLSAAWELARRGLTVTVLDQQAVGREASWAGAGILPPGHLKHADDGESRLRAFSHSLWDGWSRSLREATGIDNGYHRCGGLELSFDQSLAGEVCVWRNEGVPVEPLTTAELRCLEPAIHAEGVSVFRLPELGQVRNPRHLKALRAGCLSRGVMIEEGSPVTGWIRDGERLTAAVTPTRTVRADRFLLTTGAWSRTLLQQAGFEFALEPVRGQIALLSVPRPLFRHVVQVGPRYLVPRPDGRILAGSTEERAGFVKRNTVAGIQSLLEFAASVVPALRDAELERCWSGLRPWSGQPVPLIDRVPGAENLFVATGHFRSGLQMSPGTAVLVSQLLLEETPAISVEPYSCAVLSCTRDTE